MVKSKNVFIRVHEAVVPDFLPLGGVVREARADVAYLHLLHLTHHIWREQLADNHAWQDITIIYVSFLDYRLRRVDNLRKLYANIVRAIDTLNYAQVVGR